MHTQVKTLHTHTHTHTPQSSRQLPQKWPDLMASWVLASLEQLKQEKQRGEIIILSLWFAARKTFNTDTSTHRHTKQNTLPLPKMQSKPQNPLTFLIKSSSKYPACHYSTVTWFTWADKGQITQKNKKKPQNTPALSGSNTRGTTGVSVPCCISALFHSSLVRMQGHLISACSCRTAYKNKQWMGILLSVSLDQLLVFSGCFFHRSQNWSIFIAVPFSRTGRHTLGTHSDSDVAIQKLVSSPTKKFNEQPLIFKNHSYYKHQISNFMLNVIFNLQR